MSLHIAYEMRKKAKKMAKGCAEDCDMPHEHDYAHGGHVKGVHKSGNHLSTSTAGELATVSKKLRDRYEKDGRGRVYGEEKAGDGAMSASKDEHRRVLSEMHEMADHDRKYLAEGGMLDDDMEMENPPMSPIAKGMKKAFHAPGYAEGGEVEDDMDLVARIMKNRFSEGGKVANKDEVVADFEPNEFDEIPLEDDLSFHYTGKNSGDEEGDKHIEEEDKDVVSRIMKSRGKKDRMPRPA